MLIILIN